MGIIEDKVLSLQSENNREGKGTFYKEKIKLVKTSTTRFKTIMIRNLYYNKEIGNRGWLALTNKTPSDMFNYYKYDER